MAFDAFHQHCNRCKKGKPCKRRHVYIMELDHSILEKKKFRDANPKYQEGMDCLYVGKTRHHPRCRQSMHRNCKPGDWDGKVWECYCSISNGSNLCELSNKAAPFVAGFITGFLKKKSIYKEYNPQRGPKANQEAEEKLADDLRELGYGIWQN